MKRRSRSRGACRARRACSAPSTQIAVTVDERNRRSVLELVAGDRPGLLCDVGKVLMEERVDLLAAKIMTVGERAEDVFYLASLSGSAARRSRGHAPAAAPVRRARSPRRRVNGRLELLAAYPFERLARLKSGITPPASLPHIAMSIGEPKHAPPRVRHRSAAPRTWRSSTATR